MPALCKAGLVRSWEALVVEFELLFESAIEVGTDMLPDAALSPCDIGKVLKERVRK